MTAVLQQVSDALATTVATLSPGIVRVEARRCLPASGLVWSRDGIIVTTHHVIEQDDNIRVGLHSGRPSLTDTGYVGLSVHTAARVCSSAHGGQIVVSGEAKRAMAGSSSAGVGLLHEFFDRRWRDWRDRIAIDIPPADPSADRIRATYADLAATSHAGRA